MSKHTPGPWSLSTVPTSMGTCHKIGPFPSNGVYAETHACVYADNVRESDYGHSKMGDELLANARLIAAAPDLLGALEALSAYCERSTETGFDPFDADQFIEMARTAIAKAKGEQ